MIEILLATQLSCSDGYWILDGVEMSNMSRRDKSELKIEIIKEMPDNCNREDHEPRPRNR